MKKRIIAIILAIVCITAMTTACQKANDTPKVEDIPDSITIEGVEYNTSLTELDLSFMGVTNEDIIPLKYMTNLTSLSLSFNQISDLYSLSNLTNLLYLELFDIKSAIYRH